MSVALVASLFALLIVTADAQSKCKTKFLGQKIKAPSNTLVQVALPDVQIAKNVMTKDVVVPQEIFKRVICLGGKHLGTRMTACDYDEVPKLKMIDLNNAVVTRQSDGRKASAVFTTVYCKMSWDPEDEDHALEPYYYKFST